MAGMRGIWRLGLLGLVAAGSAGAQAAERLPGPFVARVVDVIDGDTLSVEVPVWLGVEIATKVRLRGIDTPELHGRCRHEKELAAAARRYLADRTTAEVRLTDVGGDKYYGRVEADAATMPGGQDLGEAMLASGLARPYDGGKRGGWCGFASLGE